VERRPIASLLAKSIAALETVSEITETGLNELRQARKKLWEELNQLTPVQAKEAFRRASQELQRHITPDPEEKFPKPPKIPSNIK